jgi:DNA methylase
MTAPVTRYEPSLYEGDMAILDEKVDDGSVDLILTDPPYSKESVPLFGRLGEFAARKLKPGGYLLTYVPSRHLPQVLGLLGQQLEWFWMFAVGEPGDSIFFWPVPGPVIIAKHVQVACYRRPGPPLYPNPRATSSELSRIRGHLDSGDARGGENTRGSVRATSRMDRETLEPHGTVRASRATDPSDLSLPGRSDKDWHRWEQDIEPVRNWIVSLSPPEGGLVVDPFLGGGTVAVAAYEAGRRFIGSDIDPEAVRSTRARVAQFRSTPRLDEY